MRRLLTVLMCVLTSAISFSQTDHIPANEDLLLTVENEALKLYVNLTKCPTNPLALKRPRMQLMSGQIRRLKAANQGA